MRLILCGLFLLSTAYAADFSKADALFAQRENNFDAIHQARALYQDVLYNDGDQTEQMRAMNQLGKLAYYEGELLTPMDDSSTRKSIFAQNQEYAEHVGSAYWKALSLALWCQSASSAEAWWYLDDFKAAANLAFENDVIVNDGGIFRLLAGVYIKSTELESYGLYDPKLALEYANKAIELGPNQLEAYWIKANVLRELKQPEAAKQLLENILETFHSTPELEPENKVISERIKKEL
ncbi:MAG: hypothetical protein WCK49_06660 [Myxococcaceae bacterium]